MAQNRDVQDFDQVKVLKIEDPQAGLFDASLAFTAGDQAELFILEPALRLPVTLVTSKPDALTLQLNDNTTLPVSQPKAALLHAKDDKICYLEGTLHQDGKNWVLSHAGRALRTQRRLFHRFNFRKKFHLENITLPDSGQLPALSAVLQDCSLIGVGFRARQKLPTGTRFASHDLFQSADEIKDLKFYLQVVWARGNRIFGFHHGAVFKFQSETEQAEFNLIIEKLQVRHFSDCYRCFVSG
jgi:hypothetical protein